MRTITSRQHAIVKQFRRAATGDAALALLDGWHLVGDALGARLTIETIAVAGGQADDEARGLVARAAAANIPIVEVSAAVMNAISPVRSPTGIVALVERRAWRLEQLLTPGPALAVVAVDMQDPGNVGAVIRSAEAGGATGVVFAGASADPWSWKALRASMGSTLRLPVLRMDLALPVITELQAAGVSVIASVTKGGTAMHEADLGGHVAIVIGGEGPGLSRAVVDAADRCVSIAMRPPVESLNAAVAAALLVYEARRQRDEAR